MVVIKVSMKRQRKRKNKLIFSYSISFSFCNEFLLYFLVDVWELVGTIPNRMTVITYKTDYTLVNFNYFWGRTQNVGGSAYFYLFFLHFNAFVTKLQLTESNIRCSWHPAKNPFYKMNSNMKKSDAHTSFKRFSFSVQCSIFDECILYKVDCTACVPFPYKFRCILTKFSNLNLSS